MATQPIAASKKKPQLLFRYIYIRNFEMKKLLLIR